MDTNGLDQGTCEHFRGAGKKTTESLAHYNLPFYYHTHLDRFNRGCSFVMDPLVDRHYLVSLWPIPGPDTSATHRSETDIAVLKYLEEGLTVGLNSVVLSQKKTVGEPQLLKSHECWERSDRLPRICLCRPEENAEYAQEVH